MHIKLKIFTVGIFLTFNIVKGGYIIFRYSLLKTRWCSWLRRGTTNQKVMGSIPDGVTGTFH
jgi:hypothetical protein